MWFLVALVLMATISLQNQQHSTFAKDIFSRSSSTLFNGIIPVSKYSTTKTGLTIVIAETDGPFVSGYFCLATGDIGLAHALEHLIFLGSEDYPYNGAFGLLASRNLGVVNAFTDIDRTCFESSHFGDMGFLRFLPIYLDHIFYPTLEPSQFTTEVCHVNGEGLNGGIIYSEEEARMERDHVHYHALMDALYKNYDYKNATVTLKSLRENTTHQMVVAYHKKFYRPENMCIIIFGTITIDDVMSSITKIEAKMSLKSTLPKLNRPWKTPVPVLETTVVKRAIPWGLDGFSYIHIGWRGPNCVTEYRKLLACQTLISYLSAAIPADSFAEEIMGDTVENSETALYFKFMKVPVEDIYKVYSKFHERLQYMAKGIERIDLRFMKSIINSRIIALSQTLEKSHLQIISKLIVNDFLYGSNPNDFEKILNIQDELKYLQVVPVTYWINILNEYFIDKNYVLSIGISNASLADSSKKKDKVRIAKRIVTLGPAGLKKKKDELAKAIALNSRPVPNFIVDSMPLLVVKYKRNVNIYRAGSMNDEAPPGLDLNSWPIYAEAYDCRTNYVYITTTFFTDSVEKPMRPYLLLLLKLMHDDNEDDADIVGEEVIKFKPISSDYFIGLTCPESLFSCGLYSQTASFKIQVELYEYEVGVKHLIDKLQNTVFDVDSIGDAAKTLLSQVSDYKFNGYDSGALDLLRTMYYEQNTNVKCSSMIYQETFLRWVLENLNDDALSQQIIDNVYRLRDFLVSASNLAVHVTADFDMLLQDNTDLNEPWQGFQVNHSPKRLNIIPDWHVRFAAENNGSRGEVVALKLIESAYLYHSSPALLGFYDNDLAPLIVALTYCSQVGGPMYRRVRGPGYTYFYKLEVIPIEGIIRLKLDRASDLVAAFNETVNIINELIHPDAVWEEILVDSAKGAAISDIVNSESNLADVPIQSLLLSFKDVSSDYTEYLIDKIYGVTVDDLKRVAELYMTNIFSSAVSKTAIVCNYDEASRISKGFENKFEKLGFILPIRESWEESLLGQFNDF